MFGKKIADALTLSGIKAGIVLDCPCGNGEVSHFLSRNRAFHVIGADMDQSKIDNCIKNFRKPNLEFKTLDIFDMLSQKNRQYDVICLVNSLFLLSNHTDLFKLIKNNLRNADSLFVLIIPNTKSENFKKFQAQFPLVNKIVINENEIRSILTENGFTIKQTQNIAQLEYYNRKDIRFFSVLAPFYLLTINFFKSLYNSDSGSYTLYCLSKL